MPRFFVLLVFCTLATLGVPSTMSAEAAQADRFQMNHDIYIQPGERVGDVTCINCSVHVRGQVSGDVTAIHGNVFAAAGASIAGDVVVIAGNARLANGSQVAGDLDAIGGAVHRDPQAAVAGEITTTGGGSWMLLILLLPFAILGGIVALAIWLIQRSRRPHTPVPAYALRRN